MRIIRAGREANEARGALLEVRKWPRQSASQAVLPQDKDQPQGMVDLDPAQAILA